MATPITTTKARAASGGCAPHASCNARRTLPGWLWFVLLWCGGVGAAVSLGFAFKIFMNLTLFAIK